MFLRGCVLWAPHSTAQSGEAQQCSTVLHNAANTSATTAHTSHPTSHTRPHTTPHATHQTPHSRHDLLTPTSQPGPAQNLLNPS